MSALKDHEAAMQASLTRAHGHATKRMDGIEAKSDSMAVRELKKSEDAHTGFSSRIDEIESVLDQLRGAKNAIYALIGTNVFVVAITIYTVFIEPNA